jgi:chromosome segregation ATPase
MLGLVRASRFAALLQKLKKNEARVEKLSQQLAQTRAELEAWRGKAAEAQDALKKAQAAADRARRETDEQRQLARRALKEAERKAGAARPLPEVESLQKRLAESERELTIAREHLMAIEVKLDILEGAANVLDGRTRSVLADHTGGQNGPAV